jgi:hypothetical protein
LGSPNTGFKFSFKGIVSPDIGLTFNSVVSVEPFMVFFIVPEPFKTMYFNCSTKTLSEIIDFTESS